MQRLNLTGDARGASSIEYLLVGSMLFALIFTGFEIAIQQYSRQAAVAAAQAACERARAVNSTDPTGAALQVTDQAGLSEVSVQVDRRGGTVVCTVSGRAGSIVAPRFTETAQMPVEGM